MKKVLVTGGTGLLGNNIVRQLAKSNVGVTAAVRKSSSLKPFSDFDVETLEVDFEDDSSIRHCLEGIDTVIHSAAFIWFGWSKLEESRRVNVGITSRIAKICLELGIRMVHVSTLDTFPVGNNNEVLDEESLKNPSKYRAKVPCNYVVSKREADQKVREYFERGLSGCIVHPGMMLGPYDWRPSSGELIRAICKVGFWFSCPTGGISLADVRDVAAATIQAAKDVSTDGRQYILGGHNIAYRKLTHLIADKCGVSRPRGRTGPVALMMAGVFGNITTWLGNENMANTATVRMAQLWHFYSSDRAIAELNYQIRDLDEILDNAIDWLAGQQMIKLPKREPAI